ncbi:MAG TPA: hypothetical protein QGF95_09375 [Candidatus Latescibacteria bacterium]|nr:hypothetical protein [Candidatus Latescibacterota bacterium]HJP30750.1 hypothetical protein [Candidatus Latescibacterota bacterium]
MTRRKTTSHADRTVGHACMVESFLERGYLVVEDTPTPALIGDLLEALTATGADGADRGELPPLS